MEVSGNIAINPVATATADQSTARTRPKHQFTRENAAEMARRSTEARLRREREQESKAAEYDALAAVPEEQFRLKRLQRVRKQLMQIDDMIEQETDAQTLERLARAQGVLSVQEFALAGRPMPGSLRPKGGSDRAKKPAAIEPL